eukprot:CAMPEP_0174718830 /NCGR_PEP_ID=MMETSP1094-20130205/30107_1 /TAXON_ID=156173 /ORGANISM="Chrysochromulina brevifilum, Strain UTEX LB 985" /LENGTH=66 /DNA_ID=CAMNT_0015919029 /DNA_START=229 /DNA_END=429 /DNA_ORIENTATION=+
MDMPLVLVSVSAGKQRAVCGLAGSSHVAVGSSQASTGVGRSCHLPSHCLLRLPSYSHTLLQLHQLP